MESIYFLFITILARIIASNKTSEAVDSKELFNPAYERLSFFSKISALTNCITYDQLQENKTFLEGGCPLHLHFCSDISYNHFADQVIIKKIILAKNKFELGTGFIAIDHHHQAIHMAFRGSSTRWDWLHDFSIAPTEYTPFSFKKYVKQVELGNIPRCDDCKLHSGFNKFLSSLQESFLTTLENTYNSYPDYNLVISGHSLGAAVAVLCGLEVKIRGYNPTVVTYAQPKIFNSKMSQWVNEMFDIFTLDASNRCHNTVDLKSGYYRLVHINDYVTDLPPLYSHSGLQININKIMLPHEIDDLSYVGLNYASKNDIQASEKIVGPESLSIDETSLATDLLHLYEHRNYFIQINECDYF